MGGVQCVGSLIRKKLCYFAPGNFCTLAINRLLPLCDAQGQEIRTSLLPEEEPAQGLEGSEASLSVWGLVSEETQQEPKFEGTSFLRKNFAHIANYLHFPPNFFISHPRGYGHQDPSILWEFGFQ